jgi:hypothetical protein
MQQGGDKQENETTVGLPASETTNIHTGHTWTLANSYSNDNEFYTHSIRTKWH